MGGLGFKDFFQWGKQASQKEYLHLLQMLWILYCMYIDAKMGEHFAWPIITPDDRCCPQLSTLLSSVLSLLSEYPLPLFVPDSLPHYWSCTGCHRRINSGHCSPGVDIRVSPPPLLLFQHNRVMGLVITRSCCSFSHTTLLLLNKYTSSILSSPLLIISLASAVTF